LNKLISLLSSKSKHGNYQMLPPQLLNKLPELKQYSHTRRLDDKRYEWIVNNIDLSKKSIIDIGANVGYFSIRFASEKKI
jgi:2-polyprenyl-3-methyl-5-hydroxy-6-metoxy-1,4-benzoquinol methylase